MGDSPEVGGKGRDNEGRHQGRVLGTERGTFTFMRCFGGDVDRIE